MRGEEAGKIGRFTKVPGACVSEQIGFLRNLSFVTLSVTGGTLVGVGMAELMARSIDLPRIQVVELTKDGPTTFKVVDGVPLWSRLEELVARVGDCEDDTRPQLWLLGSSIFYGSGLGEGDQHLAELLGKRLPEYCVRNFAQPAYSFSNQLTQLNETLKTEDPPAVLVWELWHNSVNQWTVDEDRAYNFGGRGPAGVRYPNPLGLGAALAEPLFRSSALYRHHAVRSGDDRWNRNSLERWDELARNQLNPAVQRLRAAGAVVVLPRLPSLSRPFSETAAAVEDEYPSIREVVGDAAVHVNVAQGFADRGLSPEEVRLDLCCHYNSEGMEVLAATVAPAVVEAVSSVR